MMRLANAAGMLRGSDRRRDRNDGSGEREEQQQSGGQALHGFRFE
jgi:hypothetical protein